uniref:uncharacterized protein LOC113474562 n=1 Tax=Ciona intestinalis TaxID=7719 RepID=UPI000EF43C48|nr:uncharacterized protein LOC113474562 [Ciona intestinalis]|eukprot:XP_026691954.1 uncharacterized protein LOC113474562 [Ciona intestinalis]
MIMGNVNNVLLLLAQVVFVAASTDQLTTKRGSFQLSSYSRESKTKAQIVYMLCLPEAPDFVYAEARPSNQSLPYKFNLTILKIEAQSFLVELERVDQATGWDTMITVNWFLYTGIALVHQKRVFWIPERYGIKAMNQAESATYCTNRSAKLADIPDQQTYQLIYNHVETYHSFYSQPYTFVHVWLASKYSPKTGNVTQSNGEPGFNGGWRKPDFPNSHSTSTELVIRVRDYVGMDSGLLIIHHRENLELVPWFAP